MNDVQIMDKKEESYREHIKKFASKIATMICERAKMEEPTISSVVLQSVQNLKMNAQCEVIKFDERLKTRNSLIRKLLLNPRRISSFIDAQFLQGGMLDQGLSQGCPFLFRIQPIMYDAVRYTLSLSKETYTENLLKMIKILAQQNFQLLHMFNFWPISDVKKQNGSSREMREHLGIHAFFTTPNHFVFEIQFHTPDALELNQTTTRQLYEKFRQAEHESTREQFRQQLIEAWNTIAIPDHLTLLDGHPFIQSCSHTLTSFPANFTCHSIHPMDRGLPQNDLLQA